MCVELCKQIEKSLEFELILFYFMAIKQQFYDKSCP